MTGGVGYLWAPGESDESVNSRLKLMNVEGRRVVDAESPAAVQLKSLIEAHAEATGSKHAAAILADFDCTEFVQVVPPSEVKLDKNSVTVVVEEKEAVKSR